MGDRLMEPTTNHLQGLYYMPCMQPWLRRAIAEEAIRLLLSLHSKTAHPKRRDQLERIASYVFVNMFR